MVAQLSHHRNVSATCRHATLVAQIPTMASQLAIKWREKQQFVHCQTRGEHTGLRGTQAKMGKE